MAVWVRQDGKSRDAERRTIRPGRASSTARSTRPRSGPSSRSTLAELTTAIGLALPTASTRSTRLNDGDRAARTRATTTIPRFTWWDHRGTKEWVQYEFDSPQKVSAVEVYWFDDERVKRPLPRARSRGSCSTRTATPGSRSPAPSAYGTAIDKYNRVTFEPVETTGAADRSRSCSPTWSGGILEWKVE